jgi:hypothetical protein
MHEKSLHIILPYIPVGLSKHRGRGWNLQRSIDRGWYDEWEERDVQSLIAPWRATPPWRVRALQAQISTFRFQISQVDISQWYQCPVKIWWNINYRKMSYGWFTFKNGHIGNVRGKRDISTRLAATDSDESDFGAKILCHSNTRQGGINVTLSPIFCPLNISFNIHPPGFKFSMKVDLYVTYLHAKNCVERCCVRGVRMKGVFPRQGELIDCR